MHYHRSSKHLGHPDCLLPLQIWLKLPSALVPDCQDIHHHQHAPVHHHHHHGGRVDRDHAVDVAQHDYGA